MTRRSKRELEREIDGLGSGDEGAPSPLLVWEDPETGVWHDGDGTVYESTDVDPVAVIPEPLEGTSEHGGMDR